MSKQLSVSSGQYSHKGKKETNQDSHGIHTPSDSQLATKGITAVIADGISSSNVSDIASKVCVKSFIEDYYCTSDTWSVRTSAERVLRANNSWLFAQNQREVQYRLNKDLGYVCTFSALIFKSNTAYLFHVGDSQVSLLKCSTSRDSTKILSTPHRSQSEDGNSYLARAIGVKHNVDIDYVEHTVKVGDTFLLATDGVYEFISHDDVGNIIEQHSNDLELAAQKVVETAIEQGSDDNLTAQIIRIDQLSSSRPSDFLQELNGLPFPPALSVRSHFDGYEILRELHKNSRSHVVLAKDIETQERVVIKLPSSEGRQDEEYVERFLMEEWIANRLNNAHIVKSHKAVKKRQYCYLATEYIEGQTLREWMNDNPTPSLQEVREIVAQISIGLQALHRQEMLHQDLRPENVMIDTSGVVKIIDFGSVFIYGIEETRTTVIPAQTMPGTALFLAPEYFIGEYGSKRSDIYSLACITYQLINGGSPYGTNVPKAQTRAAQKRLVYQSVLDPQRQIPAWVDLTLKKALDPDPNNRYPTLSEFIQDLRKPNAKFIARSQAPLIERDPVLVWKSISAALSVVIMVLLYQLFA